MDLFKKPEYTSDEIKLHIKRLEREIKELQNKYNIALLRSKELYSKAWTMKEIFACYKEYGIPKDILYNINSCKDSILIYKDMLKSL